MPNPRRRERLGALIEEVVSEVIQRELKDPRVAGLVSITRVDVTRDGRLARIFISIMGTDEERAATMRALEHATGFIRSKLGGELTIRHVPELAFIHDRSIEQGVRVIQLINRLAIPPEPPESPEAQ